MQFMPSTFAAYAVDGDGDGRADIRNPADAVYTAAHYLCANEAGSSDDGLRSAIFRYNHADWYVAMVLRIAAPDRRPFRRAARRGLRAGQPAEPLVARPAPRAPHPANAVPTAPMACETSAGRTQILLA